MIPPIEERLRYAEAKAAEFEAAARSYARDTHPMSILVEACQDQAASWRSVAAALRAEMESAK
jgi:hypothetical protein